MLPVNKKKETSFEEKKEKKEKTRRKQEFYAMLEGIRNSYELFNTWYEKLSENENVPFPPNVTFGENPDQLVFNADMQFDSSADTEIFENCPNCNFSETHESSFFVPQSVQSFGFFDSSSSEIFGSFGSSSTSTTTSESFVKSSKSFTPDACEKFNSDGIKKGNDNYKFIGDLAVINGVPKFWRKGHYCKFKE